MLYLLAIALPPMAVLVCGMGWTPQLGQRRGQVKRDSRWKV